MAQKDYHNMLKEITSLWDYYNKCREDKAYEEVAIRGYKSDTYNSPPFSFERAKVWIDKWVQDTVREGYEDTCLGMANYLNRQIRQMNKDVHRNEVAQAQIIQQAIETARLRAQATGQPVITAQQTPTPADPIGTIHPGVYTREVDWTQVTQNPIAQHYANYTIDIDPQLYGTITVDNTGAHINNPPTQQPAPPMPPTPPRPPVENLWPDFINEPPDHPDNPTEPTTPHVPRPGEICEYGWYDQDIETEIQMIMAATNLPREDAIIRVFNDTHRLPTVLPDEDVGDWEPEIDDWEDTPPPVEER